MRILHVLPSVDPRGGGPMEALRHYGTRLRSLGHEQQVLTLDDPRAPYLPEYPLPVSAIGPSIGGYAYNSRLGDWLRRHGPGFNAIVVHGLWQYHSFGTWRALRRQPVPYFVLPHGMLDPWFKTTYPLKHLKKCLYWPWADYRVLRDARAVLFTCEEERLLARQSFNRYRAQEAVIEFGTSAPPADADRLRSVFETRFPSLRGRRILLFLSRLHPKKGCDLLIEAFARVAATNDTLHLMIAGPDQIGWLSALRELAQQLGVSERISFPGMLQGDLKWGAFYSSEVFVLPSHQENFGIAVAEALGCSLPVLISDKVNIWREVQADGAGITGSDTVEGTEQSLAAWLALGEDARNAMRAQARACFEKRFTAEATAHSLLGALSERIR